MIKKEFDELKELVTAKKNENKMVIIINGNGASGKDYLISSLKEFNISYDNVSSIDPIKSIVRYASDSKEIECKTDKIRRLLHDLKKSFDSYNHYTTRYIIKKFNTFMDNWKKERILFVHIGEASNINLFKSLIGDLCVVKTLFIKSDDESLTCVNDPRYGLEDKDNSNSNNEEFYDYVFINKKSEESNTNKFNFARFINNISSCIYTNNSKFKLILAYDSGEDIWRNAPDNVIDVKSEYRQYMEYIDAISPIMYDRDKSFIEDLLKTNTSYNIFITKMIDRLHQICTDDSYQFAILRIDEVPITIDIYNHICKLFTYNPNSRDNKIDIDIIRIVRLVDNSSTPSYCNDKYGIAHPNSIYSRDGKVNLFQKMFPLYFPNIFIGKEEEELEKQRPGYICDTVINYIKKYL